MPYFFNIFTGTLDYFSGGSTTIATSNIRSRVQPTESPDGSRTSFTVPETYIAGSLSVTLNGLNESNVTEVTTTTFSFSTAPLAGDDIRLSYAVSV